MCRYLYHLSERCLGLYSNRCSDISLAIKTTDQYWCHYTSGLFRWNGHDTSHHYQRHSDLYSSELYVSTRACFRYDCFSKWCRWNHRVLHRCTCGHIQPDYYECQWLFGYSFRCCDDTAFSASYL